MERELGVTLENVIKRINEEIKAVKNAYEVKVDKI
jgi:hypothetical protein